MITAMHSLVAASKRDWELVLPESRTRASIGAMLRCEEGAYYGLHPGKPMYSQFEWYVVRVWCVLTIGLCGVLVRLYLILVCVE